MTQMRRVFAGGIMPTARLPSPLWRRTRARVLPRGATDEEGGTDGGGEVLSAALGSDGWTSSPLEDIYQRTACALFKRCSSFYTSVRTPPRVLAISVPDVQVAGLRPNLVWGTQAFIYALTGSPHRLPALSDPWPYSDVCIYSSLN